jgi:hypothetical protein
VDLNSDGHLNGEEVMNLLRPDHTTNVLGEAYDLMQQLDSNDDHELSMDEFLKGAVVVAHNRLFNFDRDAHRDIEASYSEMTGRIRRLASRVRHEL